MAFHGGLTEDYLKAYCEPLKRAIELAEKNNIPDGTPTVTIVDTYGKPYYFSKGENNHA